ncbi:MAG: RsmB/NOP family class I SAM-dependent RNA methyltransferase [Hyphomonadaceae bacterium]|nr:RsmB/NOP family class I SAM-dependent RNA methyltransferase [Hyphomonadaceae bacterium]
MARPPKQPREEAAGWQSRLAAAELLHATLDKGVDLEVAQGKSRNFDRLEGPDRGFARAIAGAALRGVGRIDWALSGMLDRPMADIQPEVRALLRAGAAQLWMLDVAPHAAVSATVEAARNWPGATKGGGLINAVLRRAGREMEAFQTAPPASVWPDWLAAKLKSALGPERADAMAELQLEEPPVDLSLKPGVDAVELAGMLGGEVLPTGTVRVKAGMKLGELPGYAAGDWWVQDAAAALAAVLLDAKADEAVADLCAAPGGAAMQLAAAGAKLTAVDMSRQRLALLRETMQRTRLPMEVVEADAREWRPAAPLDAVLLDAPCSALGTLRRYPEGAWRRDPKDLARLPAIQRSLVDAAGEMLRPGGRLVYCVSTPAAEEGREVIEAAFAGGGWRRVKITAGELPGFGHALTDDGDVITAPPMRDSKVADAEKIVAEPIKSDVFYIARLERTKL